MTDQITCIVMSGDAAYFLTFSRYPETSSVRHCCCGPWCSPPREAEHHSADQKIPWPFKCECSWPCLQQPVTDLHSESYKASLTISGERYTLWSSSLCNFLPALVINYVLGTNTLINFSNMFSDILNLCSSLNLLKPNDIYRVSQEERT